MIKNDLHAFYEFHVNLSLEMFLSSINFFSPPVPPCLQNVFGEMILAILLSIPFSLNIQSDNYIISVEYFIKGNGESLPRSTFYELLIMRITTI